MSDTILRIKNYSYHLKPSSILINSHAHLVIADLGLAKTFTLHDSLYNFHQSPTSPLPCTPLGLTHSTTIDGLYILDGIVGFEPFFVRDFRPEPRDHLHSACLDRMFIYPY
ncbi:hypothetical protein DFH29DRAFT_1005537 [Suillus ampliporus]|nr:hypothetical protein DFH29DRAFT_1005537 [Suillus ampliporus]